MDSDKQLVGRPLKARLVTRAARTGRRLTNGRIVRLRRFAAALYWPDPSLLN